MAPNKWLVRLSSVTASPVGPAPAPEAIESFRQFAKATTFVDAQRHFGALCASLGLAPDRIENFYPHLKHALKAHVPFKYRDIFGILDAKVKSKVYASARSADLDSTSPPLKVLVVGAGPCGMRAAIETQMLGARTVVVERRDEFTRNNIVKLWKFLISDLKDLAIKKFVGNFCSGAIDTVGIKTLQLFLAKIALLLGVQIVNPVKFEELVEPHDGIGWTAKYSPVGNEFLEAYTFDMLIVASGKRVAINDFDRRQLDAKMAIAITANFANKRTREEADVQQISGLSKQYNLDFFKGMREKTGIDLENIIYYRGDTHYFVMTALRQSLLAKGVILSDRDDRATLLAPDNIDREKLHEYAIEAAQHATGHFSTALPVTEFALDGRGLPDCAIFDFTTLYSATNASRMRVRAGFQLLMAIAGDSLLEPFWPEGTGCGRGFLSSLDAAWMLRQWIMGRISPLEILTERENIYHLLSQTSGQGNELREDHKSYTLEPSTRYRNIPSKIDHDRILRLYDTDAQEEFEYLREKFMGRSVYEAKAHKTLLQKVRKGLIKRLRRQPNVAAA